MRKGTNSGTAAKKKKWKKNDAGGLGWLFIMSVENEARIMRISTDVN